MNYQPILGDGEQQMQPCNSDQPPKPSSIKVKYPLFLVAAADEKKNKGNMFQRAQREDVKPPAGQPDHAKPVSKAEVRRRIIGARGLEVNTDNYRKPGSKEFFSSRKNFANGEPVEAGLKSGDGEAKQPKKYQTDRSLE